VGEGERPAARLTYRLDAQVARWRARWTAVLAAASALAPVALVVVLLHKIGYRLGGVAAAVVALVVTLAIARVYYGYSRLFVHLQALRVDVHDDALDVATHGTTFHVPREALEKVTEIEGRLGGLRLHLADTGEAPARLDIPRGGERFGELRSALSAWSQVARAPRRRRIARLIIGALVALGIFFLPFVFDQAIGKNKMIALALVLGLWLALRFVSRLRD
jgi:hypothetical protein